MKPIFSVAANGNDITAMLADRLNRLVVTDEAGLKSDRAEFEIDNREQKVKVPPTGVALDIRLGYEDGESWITGKYTVDNVGLRGAPDALSIGAHAMDMTKLLRTPRSQAWGNVSIADVVASIAMGADFQAKVADPLASKSLGHVVQSEESDLHFLQRLAEQYGAVFKAANGFLIFAPRQQLKSFTQQTLPAVTVTPGQCTKPWQYESTERGRFTAVVARWRDLDAGADVEERVGEADGPAFTLRKSFASATEARAAAQAKLDAFNRGTATLKLKLEGLPAAKAERPLVPSGFHTLIDDAEWVISKATHTYAGEGLTSSIEAEIKK